MSAMESPCANALDATHRASAPARDAIRLFMNGSFRCNVLSLLAPSHALACEPCSTEPANRLPHTRSFIAAFELARRPSPVRDKGRLGHALRRPGRLHRAAPPLRHTDRRRGRGDGERLLADGRPLVRG